MVSRPTRQAIGACAMATVMTTGLGLGAVSAQPDEVPQRQVDVTDHGVAAAEVNVRASSVGTLPDGRDVVYMVSNGKPVSFTVVDLATGELISNHSLEPKDLAAQVEVLDDGGAYFSVRDGSGTILYHWDPETFEVEEVADNPVGERLIRGLEMGEDGLLYGSTYPSAKVFSYDPETGEFHDYGSTASDEMYAWGFAVHDGTAYVGTGMEVGRYVTVDLDGGEITELQMPTDYEEQLTYFYDGQVVGDLIAMAFSPGLPGGTNTLFWDTAAQDWACAGAIPEFLDTNFPFTDQTHDGRMHYKAGGEIWLFDSGDCTVEATGWIDTGLEETGSHRMTELVTTGDGDDAEYTIVGVNNDGSFWHFDPDSGEHEFFDSAVPGSALTAHALHVGLDGLVYVSTYLGPGVIGRFDPETQEKEQLSGPTQADSFLTFGDQMLVGSYGNAVVHMGDPTQEWNWDVNPAEQFRLIGGYQQDRIVGMDTDGELVALSTVSDYGVAGGALTLTDMADYRETYRDLVDQQSTAAATFGADGLVYAGTGRMGGINGPVSPLDAHLVTFDPEAGEVIDAIVPVEDNRIVADLVAVGDQIWGVTTSGHIFGYDTASAEVVEVQDLGTGGNTSNWGLGVMVQEHPNGMLYGLSGGNLFAFDPHEGESEILIEDDYRRLDIAEDGTIYLITDRDLHSVDLGDAGQDPLTRLDHLRSVTEEYRSSGDIADGLADRLDNALAQAGRNLTDERHLPAVRTIEDFLRHVDGQLDPDVLSKPARTDLRTQAQSLLALLQ